MMQGKQKASKVYIASKQVLWRFGVKSVIHDLGIMADIEEFTSIEEFINSVNNDCTHIVLEENLFKTNGKLMLDRLFQVAHTCNVLVIGDGDYPGCRSISSSDGFNEVLNKFQEFFAEDKANGERYDDLNKLSDRELEVLKEVSKGYANKEIADRLHISINTVITHRKNITEKLEIKTIAGLTVYALINNLISPEDSQQ